MALREQILIRIHLSLCIEDGQKVRQPGLILDGGQLEGLLVSFDRGRKPVSTILLVAVRHERIFSLFQRGEDRGVISSERFLHASVLNRHIGANFSAGEDRDTYGRAGGKEVSEPQRQVVKLSRLASGISEKLETWKIVSFRYSDASRRGRKLSLAR